MGESEIDHLRGFRDPDRSCVKRTIRNRHEDG